MIKVSIQSKQTQQVVLYENRRLNHIISIYNDYYAALLETRPKSLPFLGAAEKTMLRYRNLGEKIYDGMTLPQP